MENIDLFEDYTATILAQLYKSFPVPIAIDARKISGHSEINKFGCIVDDHGMPSQKFAIAMSTMNWLIGAGFVTCRAKNQLGHAEVCLTVAGLQILNAVPDAQKSKEARGAKLVRLVREGSGELVRDVVKSVISSAIAGAMA